jgi:hypothetical protein
VVVFDARQMLLSVLSVIDAGKFDVVQPYVLGSEIQMPL